MTTTIVLGLLVGLAFGYVSQRGRFCMLTAVADLARGREPNMLRAYLLAVLIQMLAVNFLAHLGYLQPTVLPFFGVATALGGVLFGLGMVLGVGCAGAVLYRLAEGKIEYLAVTAAYAIGVWGSGDWLVDPLRRMLHGEGQALRLNEIVFTHRWPIIAIAVLCIGAWIIPGKRSSRREYWNWPLTGSMLGLVGIAAWVASTIAGTPAGLGTFNGSRSLAQLAIRGDISALDWNLFLFAGIPLGAFIASWLHGSSPPMPSRSYRIPRALGGGLLMGLGAALVDGDNVLHGLTGVPLLAMSSVTFMLCAWLTAWVGIRLGWLGR